MAINLLDSLAYWMGSPTSELSDIENTWSPSSSSNFSDQENFHGHSIVSSNDSHNASTSFSSGSPVGSFSGFPQDPSEFGKASSSIGSKKGRSGVKRVHQRVAANQRERKRMKTINDAFEGLRVRIPMACADRKLSKVDTLRMAIGYIQQLSELLDSCGAPNGHFGGKNSSESSKVIIRYHNTPEYSDFGEDMYSMQYPPLYGHSLSWEDPKSQKVRADNKMSARVWIPETPSAEDMTHLSSMS